MRETQLTTPTPRYFSVESPDKKMRYLSGFCRHPESRTTLIEFAQHVEGRGSLSGPGPLPLIRHTACRAHIAPWRTHTGRFSTKIMPPDHLSKRSILCCPPPAQGVIDVGGHGSKRAVQQRLRVVRFPGGCSHSCGVGLGYPRETAQLSARRARDQTCEFVRTAEMSCY